MTESSVYKSELGKQKIKDAGTLIGSGARDIKDAVKVSAEEMAAHAKSTVEEKYDIGKEKAADLATKVEEGTRKNPLLAVGGAFAAGWILSKLLK